jgi:hypothetical protein
VQRIHGDHYSTAHARSQAGAHEHQVGSWIPLFLASPSVCPRCGRPATVMQCVYVDGFFAKPESGANAEAAEPAPSTEPEPA